MSNRVNEHAAVPTFLYVPFLNQKSGVEMWVRGWPKVGDIDLMIEFLEFAKGAALPESQPGVLDTIAEAIEEHYNVVPRT